MTNVSQWSVSAASNNDAPPDGAPENMLASAVNNTMREGMAAVARWYSDTDGTLTTGGSANAYTLTTNSSHAALADQSMLAFRASFANSGAATLNVDSLGAKSLRVGGSASLVANQILADVVYVVAYNATDDAYDIVGAFNNDASNLTQGELPDARLSSNVPLLDASNTYTENQTISNASPTFILEETDQSNARYAFIGSSSQLLVGRSDGGFDIALRIIGDGAGGTTEIELNGTTLDLNGNIDADGTTAAFDFTTITFNGTVDVSGTTFSGAFTPTVASAGEVGYLGTPVRTENSSDTLVLSDAGKTIHKASGGAGETITIPANASVAFPVGTCVGFSNSGGGDLSIAITSDTLVWAADGSTGTRTLADDGFAVAVKVASTTWKISGSGLS